MKKLYLCMILLVTSSQIIFTKNWLQKQENAVKKDTKKVDAVGTTVINAIADKPVNIPVFNPPTVDQLQVSIAAMTPVQMQARVITLQANITARHTQVTDAIARAAKLIAEAGLVGGIIGGTLGGLMGAGLAAGITFVSLGMLSPQACGIMMMTGAAGTAGGTGLFADMIDGNKIKECNDEVTEYSKEIISNQTEINLLNACIQSNMTYAQIQTLTAAQIKALSKPILTAIISDLSAAQITNLTPEQFTLVTPSQIKGFTLDQIKGITPAQIAGLTPNMTPAQKDQIDALIKQLSDAVSNVFLNPLRTLTTPEQKVADIIHQTIAIMTAAGDTANVRNAEKLSLKKAEDVFSFFKKDAKTPPKNNDDSDLSQFINRCIISGAGIKADLSAQGMQDEAQKIISVIKTYMSILEQISSFLGNMLAQAAFLEVSQIPAFTIEQIGAMSKDQILGISPLQIQVMSPQQFAAINANIIASMTPAQIGFINPFQIIMMTPAQNAARTPAQISMLTFIQIVEQIVGFFMTPKYCMGGGFIV